MPGWDASRSTQPFRPKSRFHMMSLAGEVDRGRPGVLEWAYSIHRLQVFQGFPRATVGHGKKLTGCGKADHGPVQPCVSCGVEEQEQLAAQVGIQVGRVWRVGGFQPWPGATVKLARVGRFWIPHAWRGLARPCPERVFT